MRTDYKFIYETIKSITNTITKIWKDLVETRVYKTKSKNAQEAHEAIRPTHPENKFLGANEQEKKLYELIRSRTLASQMVDAVMARNRIDVFARNANAKRHTTLCQS